MTEVRSWDFADPVTGKAADDQPAAPDSADVFQTGAAPWKDYADPTAPQAPPPDKYRQAAIDEYNRLKAAGVSLPTGYTARATQGATLGWGDEAMALLTAPIEAATRGVSLPEAYRYTRARENLNLEKMNENTEGPLGTAAGLAGGLGTGAGIVG